MKAVEISFITNLSSRQNESEWIVDFQVPEDYVYLEGHFPGNPLVPAVAQVAWLLAVVQAEKGAALGSYKMSRLKFVRAIRPLENVTLKVQCLAPKYRLAVFVGESLCSSGVLTLEADDV